MRPVSLNEWYQHVNSIYYDRNFYRSTESIYCHLVEVIGGLGVAISNGQTKIPPEQYLAKALGWWMALCGRVGVRNVEAVVWAKYPRLCPYCLLDRHDDDVCRPLYESRAPLRWNQIAQQSKARSASRPTTLAGWQDLFQSVYPRGRQTTMQFTFDWLSLDLAELAEAVRVLPITKDYFLSESADVFSWLMGAANQLRADRKDPGLLVDALAREYPPEGCIYCGFRVCKCSPIPRSTLGRISEQLPSIAFQDIPGGALFSLEQATEVFRVGETEIRILGTHVPLTHDVLEEFRLLTESILVEIRKNAQFQRILDARTTLALRRINGLAEREEVTQESVDQLVEALQSRGASDRAILSDFLVQTGSGVASGMVLQALLLALRSA